MERIINFKYTRKSKTVEKLLDEAATAHTAIYRLRAEARDIYKPGHPGLKYVMELLNRLEIYNNNSTKYLELVEDELAANSTVGVRALAEMRRVRDRLTERIEVAEQTGNVVSFMKYKQANTERPKGAA